MQVNTSFEILSKKGCNKKINHYIERDGFTELFM
jgi:hypothetical protein